MKTEIINTEQEIFQTGLRLFARIIAREIVKDRNKDNSKIPSKPLSAVSPSLKKHSIDSLSPGE